MSERQYEASFLPETGLLWPSSGEPSQITDSISFVPEREKGPGSILREQMSVHHSNMAVDSSVVFPRKGKHNVQARQGRDRAKALPTKP